MDGFALIEENRIGHRCVVVLFRFVMLVEPAHLVTAARCRIATGTGRDRPFDAADQIDGLQKIFAADDLRKIGKENARPLLPRLQSI